MTYRCDLGSGQRLHLETQGTQTIIAIASSSAGQQQQSSNSLQTGVWTSPPEVYRTSEGIVVKLQTAAGNQFIQIQGSQMSLSATALSLSNAEQLSMQQTNIPDSPMPLMPPMEPMSPMTMGTMQMTSKPMAMRMGNMEMRIGSEPVTVNTTTSTPTRQFCTQCGTSIKPSDRFCASCGHQLV